MDLRCNRTIFLDRTTRTKNKKNAKKNAKTRFKYKPRLGKGMTDWTCALFVSTCCLIGVESAQRKPDIAWVKGYSFSSPSLESHPHAGVETSDGGQP